MIVAPIPEGADLLADSISIFLGVFLVALFACASYAFLPLLWKRRTK